MDAAGALLGAHVGGARDAEERLALAHQRVLGEILDALAREVALEVRRAHATDAVLAAALLLLVVGLDGALLGERGRLGVHRLVGVVRLLRAAGLALARGRERLPRVLPLLAPEGQQGPVERLLGLLLALLLGLALDRAVGLGFLGRRLGLLAARLALLGVRLGALRIDDGGSDRGGRRDGLLLDLLGRGLGLLVVGRLARLLLGDGLVVVTALAVAAVAVTHQSSSESEASLSKLPGSLLMGRTGFEGRLERRGADMVLQGGGKDG